MIVIDTNTLILLIIGNIDTRLFSRHERTSIYDEDDYKFLCDFTKGKKLITAPNVWTEVDNLLNKTFSRNYKDRYHEIMNEFIVNCIEVYKPSKVFIKKNEFYTLG
jgi:hypothetical protein